MKIYRKCKIYYDGSHYIGLPYKTNSDIPSESIFDIEKVDKSDLSKRIDIFNYIDNPNEQEKLYHAKCLFDSNYNHAMSLCKSLRFDYYYDILKDIFPNRQDCNRFVQNNFNRKFRNFMYRKLRLLRKVNLLCFDYFCTFTYDEKKMNEEDFRKKLLYFLQNKASRNNWKYIGVFERSPEKMRLHFHSLLNADKSSIPGEFIKKYVWSSKVKRMKSVLENSYIKNRFGVNDFSPIDYEDAEEYSSCINYLLKYIEKSGEKLIYSRGLYQYLESYINVDEDVLSINYTPCTKYLLYDDFRCYDDDGTLVGKCSKEVLKNLNKVNK